MAYETPEEFRKRIARQKREVITYGNKYGWTDKNGKFHPYSVNVNNAVLNDVYKYYFSQVDNTHGAPSDEKRIKWERGIKRFLAKHFLEMYHYELDLKNVGLQVRQYRLDKLEEMVAMMDPREIIKELYGKGKKNE